VAPLEVGPEFAFNYEVGLMRDLSSASGYFPSHMALHGSENTRHKGRKELNKPYESLSL
jgi:hypothetical protein